VRRRHRRLPFRDAVFDVVLSSFPDHDVSVLRAAQRTSALREMVRVLKPGGEVALIDIVLTLDHARRLRALGMDDVCHRWRPPLWACQSGRSRLATRLDSLSDRAWSFAYAPANGACTVAMPAAEG
jgi:SAM-dependent methyltransferase